MKKFLTYVLFALSFLSGASAHAQLPPYGILVNQGSPDGTMFYGRYLTPANPNTSYFMMYNGTTMVPAMGSIGSGLVWNNTTLSLDSAFDGTYAALTGKPTRTVNYTTRALNTCFQVSTTRDAFVHYGVDISTSISLSGGQVGTVYLRSYTNSICTMNPQDVSRFVNGQTGTLTIGLALTQNVTGTLAGTILAGTWAQLVTENTTGTPVFTARPGQETLL